MSSRGHAVTDESNDGAEGATGGREPSRSEAAVTGAAYGTLLVLGAVVGVYGVFYYSLSVWSVPFGAIVAIVVNFVLCRGAARMMRTRLSAILPAVGWLAAVLPLTSKRSEGDLLITDTAGGYVLLFGGSLAAAIAVTMSVVERPGTSRRSDDSAATRG